MKNIFLFLFSLMFCRAVNAQPGIIEDVFNCHEFTFIDNGKTIDSSALFNKNIEQDLKSYPTLKKQYSWYKPIYRFISLPHDTEYFFNTLFSVIDSLGARKKSPFCLPEYNVNDTSSFSNFLIIKNNKDTMEIFYSNNGYNNYIEYVDTITFRKGKYNFYDLLRKNKHYWSPGGNGKVKKERFDDGSVDPSMSQIRFFSDSLTNVKIITAKKIYTISEEIKLNYSGDKEVRVKAWGTCQNSSPVPIIFKKTNDGFVPWQNTASLDCGPGTTILPTSYDFIVNITEPGIYKIAFEEYYLPGGRTKFWYSNEFIVK